MGGCASSSAKDSDSKMLMKLRLLFSPHKAPDTMIISSPLKDNPTINADSRISDSYGFGSKEDTFFDSKAWIDSDCEDDFFSVKGDFTPSQGNTPVHHSFSIGNLQVNKNIFNESTPEPSPNKKRLSELFQESLKEDQGINFEDHNNEIGESTKAENKTTVLGLPPVNSTIPLSSEIASKNGDYKAQKKNTLKSAQCCLPKMLSSRSFNERRSKMSPAQSIG